MTEFVAMALLTTFVVVITGALLAGVIEVVVRGGDHPGLVRRRPRRTPRRASPRG